MLGFHNFHVESVVYWFEFKKKDSLKNSNLSIYNSVTCMVETGTSYVFPVKKIIRIQNFLATRFVRLVLAGLRL